MDRELKDLYSGQCTVAVLSGHLFSQKHLRGTDPHTHTRRRRRHPQSQTAGTDGHRHAAPPRPVVHREVPWALSTTHIGSVWMIWHIPELCELGNEAH